MRGQSLDQRAACCANGAIGVGRTVGCRDTRQYLSRRSGAAVAIAQFCALPLATHAEGQAGASAKSADDIHDVPRSWHGGEYTFTLRLDGRVFTVPTISLGMVMPEAKAAGGRPGMTLHALLPGLEADTIPPEQRGPSKSNERSTFISVEGPMREGASGILRAWVGGDRTLHVGRGHPGGSIRRNVIARLDNWRRGQVGSRSQKPWVHTDA